MYHGYIIEEFLSFRDTYWNTQIKMTQCWDLLKIIQEEDRKLGGRDANKTGQQLVTAVAGFIT